MAIEDYEKAYKLGRREYQRQMAKGEDPTLPVLEDILPMKGEYSEISIGITEIPLDQVVGTKTNGRSNAFAGNFMPILGTDSEFAQKWMHLSTSHVEEGIRDPILVYEYMNKFYVQEGNKRVSVMKYFNVPVASASVIRIVPRKKDDPENKLYYEFLDFYEKTKLYGIYFSKRGSFLKLIHLAGKKKKDAWTDEERKNLSSIFARFKIEYEKKKSEGSMTASDAFLALAIIYGYEPLCNMSQEELTATINKSREEFLLSKEGEDINLQLDPTEKKPLLGKLYSLGAPKLKIAFFYEKTPSSSAWSYGHELGRLHLEQTFPEEVETYYYVNVSEENIDNFIKDALKMGCNILFTTTPAFTKASVKAAIEHPEVKILNCTVNTAHRYIRTYYVRLHEAKFLMGAIAGALAENDRISYIADYPIYGAIANINAFALGAKMVNPRAKVYLDWNCIKDYDPREAVEKIKPSCFSARDMLIPQEHSAYYGISHVEGERIRHLAMPLIHWGKFYEQLIQAIMDGSWKYDDKDESMAINYWWGMSTGAVDVVTSRNLPVGTKRLIELLKSTIMKGEFNPFTGVLYSQSGLIQEDPKRILTPEEIVSMDWLAENIIGRIPSRKELAESAIPLMRQQGIDQREG